ncbi:hypothetical protein [Alloyangia pacifica]|uniref:Uncharacterized protein n=1 Tax=Alloyangia pacifica TaxID=311180 RepID=A0A1I6PTB6_9RHOB|nr:hypothetical protein [Alloyangia pacifica]SDG35127.1 hypothetical protein SAMN04488245_102452 [Alloyangia pacifica]SFS43451.1 hypothetical protein SAMN04488050_101753 [Alloyangia pacifica]
MSQKMMGVVLWADLTEQKAVIWCEDHGELAFWHEPGSGLHDGVVLDVGDLVHFEMSEGAQLRLARNPQRLEQTQFFGLVESLKEAGDAPVSAVVERAGDSRIIAFPKQPGRERNVA